MSSVQVKWPSMGVAISIPLGDTRERAEALNNLRWLLACALLGIQSSYKPHAPRRMEMLAKTTDFLASVKPYLTPEEFDDWSRTLTDEGL